MIGGVVLDAKLTLAGEMVLGLVATPAPCRNKLLLRFIIIGFMPWYPSQTFGLGK